MANLPRECYNELPIPPLPTRMWLRLLDSRPQQQKILPAAIAFSQTFANGHCSTTPFLPDLNIYTQPHPAPDPPHLTATAMRQTAARI